MSSEFTFSDASPMGKHTSFTLLVCLLVILMTKSVKESSFHQEPVCPIYSVCCLHPNYTPTRSDLFLDSAPRESDAIYSG